MSQKQQYEEILSYYFINDYSVTPEMHNASIELRQEMSGSIDGLRWFIDSMPFELITTYQAAFECFKFQLFNNSENIPPDILSALYQLLFLNSIQMMQFNNFPPEVISELANAQMYLGKDTSGVAINADTTDSAKIVLVDTQSASSAYIKVELSVLGMTNVLTYSGQTPTFSDNTQMTSTTNSQGITLTTSNAVSQYSYIFLDEILSNVGINTNLIYNPF